MNSASQRQDPLSTPWDYHGETTDTDDSSLQDARDAAALAGLPAALAVLTPKQRFVVERLWGLTGDVYSEQEIADAMGVTQQAVSLLHIRALDGLRRKLGVV